ncbi:hypothetical protein CRUP_012048, partial [Coryphaenoides rupestris]
MAARSVDMKLIVAVLVVAIFLPDVEGRRSLLFQTATATDMVEMFPAKPLQLNAFTLCLRFATELSWDREVILFAYRTGTDEFNNHLCFTWTGLTGLATMYINGRSCVAKIYKKGHVVQPGGRIILGQDPDTLLGDFDAKQSFVGHISEVNLWDYVLLPQFIQDMVSGRRVPLPNVLDWRTVKLSPVGNVVVIDDDGTGIFKVADDKLRAPIVVGYSSDGHFDSLEYLPVVSNGSLLHKHMYKSWILPHLCHNILLELSSADHGFILGVGMVLLMEPNYSDNWIVILVIQK